MMLRQWWAMTTLSLRRYRQSQHLWIAIGLAGVPLVVVTFITAIGIMREGIDMSSNPIFLSDFKKFSQGVFTGGILHFGLIFLTLSFGNSVFREEIDGQTYHYYMLSNMPRWMIVIGKYSGFLFMSTIIYSLVLLMMKLVLALRLGSGMFGFLFNAEQITTTLIEICVLFIALAVYSALFMLLSMLFRNVLYGLFIYGWELGSNFLPEVMRNFSIAYHLKGILPYQGTDRPQFIGILAEGPGVLQIILVLSGVFIVCLSVGAFWSTRKQCLYGNN